MIQFIDRVHPFPVAPWKGGLKFWQNCYQRLFSGCPHGTILSNKYYRKPPRASAADPLQWYLTKTNYLVQMQAHYDTSGAVKMDAGDWAAARIVACQLIDAGYRWQAHTTFDSTKGTVTLRDFRRHHGRYTYFTYDDATGELLGTSHSKPA
jgi:hypothetical protein